MKKEKYEQFAMGMMEQRIRRYNMSAQQLQLATDY
jgi:hypothetical protein